MMKNVNQLDTPNPDCRRRMQRRANLLIIPISLLLPKGRHTAARPRVKAANLQRASFDAKAVPAQLRARFKRANISARELPSEVFDQTQRLKLYALSKQSEVGAAPAALPEGASELEAAKWAAWDCVRHLDQVQAMKSYTEIIEKLVQLISSSDSGGALE